MSRRTRAFRSHAVTNAVERELHNREGKRRRKSRRRSVRIVIPHFCFSSSSLSSFLFFVTNSIRSDVNVGRYCVVRFSVKFAVRP